MTARKKFTRFITGCLAVLLIGLVASRTSAADDRQPLRPPDTSSPRASLQGFIESTDDIYTRMKDVLESYGMSDRLYPTPEERRKQQSITEDAPKVARFLDISGIAPVLRDTLTIERLLQLKEILDRIELPAMRDVPDHEAIERTPTKRWRLPNTEIDLVLVENGPRAGEWLVSADTVARLPEFYERVRNLPYSAGPARQLHQAYRSVSLGGSATIYEAFLSSPIGLSHIVPIRWLLRLPAWAKVGVAGVAAWQWLGLAVGALVGGLIVYFGRRLGRTRDDSGHGASDPGWRALLLPLAIMFVAGALMPLTSALLRIGGDARVCIDYAQTVAVFLTAAWLAVVVSVIAGEAIVASEHLKARSLDSQLIRLGTRLVGIVAAVAILIHGGDEVGFPAYSVLAGLGVGGLAVALAARDTIANLIGSLLITVEKPFRIGHVVRVSGSEGTVEDVGFRSTRIRTLDNSLISIPSSVVVNTTVENLTLRTKRRQRFIVQITYDTPRDKMEELVGRIRQTILDHPLVEESTCQVRFNNFAESSLDILIIFYLYVSDYTTELMEREAVLLRIMDLVRECGVDFAFPTRTLHVENASWRETRNAL